MSQKRYESVRITGRISENTSCKEDVEFVKKKLKSMSQAAFIREAISAYRKHDEGLLGKIEVKEEDVEQENKETKKKKIPGLDDKLGSGNFF
jgi:hypothetical protein